MTTPILTARGLAEINHAGQTRRDGRTPYAHHLARVADRVRHLGADAEALAWLHDILENTHSTPEQLASHDIDSATIARVQLLTRHKATPYDAYLRALAVDPIARAVKIADILDNLTDTPSDYQVRKYARALLLLHPDA
jgi:(p)ppGpp synthase/HD superfamily hydrolase